MRILKQLMLMCLLMVSAASCRVNTEEPAPAKAAFGDVTWQLQYYRKSTAVDGALATITFSDGEVSGTTGCNHFSGQYQFDRTDEGLMRISDLVIAEMYCLEPAGLMEQEEFFMQTLSNAQRYEYNSGRLMIYQAGHEALTFEVMDE